MGINNYSVGRNLLSVVFKLPNGNLEIPAQDIIDYKITPEDNTIERKPITGFPDFKNIPGGYNVEITVTRKNANLDRYQSQWQANFRAGITLQAGTATETILDDQGNTQQFIYTGLVLRVSDLGNYNGNNDFVNYMLVGKASTRDPI